MSEYMHVLICPGVGPLFLSFWPPLKFYKILPALIYSLGLVTFIFGTWDVFATYRGHWHFSQTGTWSVRIINLPIEEILFFIIIPFCCIFTWEIVKYFKAKLK